MFYLSEIEHTLRLPPSLLSLPLQDAVKKELEIIFLDKVIANLGLCISVYDVTHIDGGFIFPGDGASTYTCHSDFLMIYTYHPIVCQSHLIPSRILRIGVSVQILFKKTLENFRYQAIWIWEFVSEDNKMEFNIDGLDEIKFRVDSVKYPPVPLEQQEKPFAPMVITGSIDDEGLGPVSWW
ncbi:DNA-directed RNA polymerase III subunit RPC8 isoform X4 [Ricinus communis]|uniref:DNA-directed RNA polymerase III subunit RPC8 isoform X4 n=1 Tax=Ricinus communis TaxID=3988 RepID=UPI0007726B5F|nr:DNA-directed RNA polymerase III subunit RPC8 isoform X4 [Ricinus communis]|eukprot:XP_015575848.1 DNA-directed RNA polymerase III subunit RPC8 isoform X2 [Ricinus communis]